MVEFSFENINSLLLDLKRDWGQPSERILCYQVIDVSLNDNPVPVKNNCDINDEISLAIEKCNSVLSTMTPCFSFTEKEIIDESIREKKIKVKYNNYLGTI